MDEGRLEKTFTTEATANTAPASPAVLSVASAVGAFWIRWQGETGVHGMVRSRSARVAWGPA